MLASELFFPAQRSKAFLRYVVDRSLAGSPPKEYEVAVEVLGRGANYNPAIDATVRVEAGRLRIRLQQYYATEGASDPIQIEIPKGAYSATFTNREFAQKPSALVAADAQRETPVADKRTELPVAEIRKHPEALPEDAGLLLPPRSPGFWRRFGIGVAAILALLAVFAFRLGSHYPSPNAAAKPKIQSLAVLPLDDLSAEPGQAYLADGITDELITMLAKNSTLRIISRTSVMQYKGVHRPLPEIARELGVDGVLEGSVARSGDAVHLTLQLIQAPSDTHLWAESYDRNPNDLVTLPREAAQAVATQLNSAKLEAAPRRTVSPEAHDAYLRGKFFWFADDNRKAGIYFKRATELQPDYALGWSGLADFYTVSALMGGAHPQQALPMAEAAAIKAVALDESLPEAHNALAAAELYQWNWAQADKESARALELNPQYAEAYHLRSYLLVATNRIDEAIAAQKKSTELDPFARPWALARIYLMARQNDAALSDARLRLETFPRDSRLHRIVVEAYRSKGMEKEAAQELEKILPLSENSKAAVSARQAFDQNRLRALTLSQLEELKRESLQQYVPPEQFASLNADLGRKEQTISLLEEAYRRRSPQLIFIQTVPEYDFLHSDKRYQAIVKGMGLVARP